MDQTRVREAGQLDKDESLISVTSSGNREVVEEVSRRVGKWGWMRKHLLYPHRVCPMFALGESAFSALNRSGSF
jgi:hypothetical protein